MHSEQIQFAIGKSSLGFVLVAESNQGLCAIFIGNDVKVLKQNIQKRFPRAVLDEKRSSVDKLLNKVIDHIENPFQKLDFQLDEHGTPFQKQVWKELRKIPIGSTVSYSDLAKKIGSPKSIRAVARACATNDVAVITPCHRVIRKNGSLSGYRWGIDIKEQLLRRESL